MVLLEPMLQNLRATRLQLAKEILVEILQTQQTSITLLWTQTLLQVEEYREEEIVVRQDQQL